ncbi:RHS repeat-associated core domain-containing protein [Pseudomonas sp. PAB10]|uniref:RHS repeat-associated core domain-containing protein n=1 Tax=Pseudomonas sp. PAB10 TaxID=3233047 RepID=UPI003F9DD63E
MEPEYAVHRNTPMLAVVDARGLAVASVAYYRKTSSDVRPETRITRETFDAAGRSLANWDPRLGSGGTPIASMIRVPGLSGQPVLTISVDAGWRLALQDDTGQVRQNWDGAGNTTCFEYDPMGRPLSIEQTSPNTAMQCVERFYYGSAESEVSARNQCGRLIRHADTAGTREVPDYNLQGEPLTESRRFLAALDHPGWPVAESQQNALLEQEADKIYSTHWQYDALGGVLEHLDAAGHARRYAYTVQGQLQSSWLTVAGKSEHVLVSDMVYNAFGQVEREKADNGVSSSSSVYDPADGRLLQLLARKGERTLQNLHYAYDPVGNIIRMADESQPVTWFANQRVEPVNRYSYDSLNQLISATGREVASVVNGPALPELISPPDPARLQHYSQTWSYDAGGNLLAQHHSGKPTHTMLVEAGSNRGLTQVEGQEPDFAASFDDNGNLKFLAPGQAMRWTARNQLSEVLLVTRANGQNDSERYLYDGAGMRVRKVRHAQAASVTRKTEVRYLPGLEIRSDGADSPDEVLHVLNVQAGRSSVRLLHWAHGQPDDVEEDQLRYSLDDYLGSSTLELDGRGSLISYEGYYAYGGTAWWMGRSQVEAKYKYVRYSGKERDATGLYYYGFRYYAPWLQRWINPDPAGIVDGLNLYGMVHNNPINLIDSSGAMSTIPESANWIWMGGSLSVGSAININKFMFNNPSYKGTLWVDRRAGQGSHLAMREMLSHRINIRNVSEIFDSAGPKLLAAFERERSGPLKNYAAASDIARVALLEKGALYMDVDVEMTAPMSPLEAKAGILIGPVEGRDLGNAIIAAPPGSEQIKAATEKIISAYEASNNTAWSVKRRYPSPSQIKAQSLARHDVSLSMQSINEKLMTIQRVQIYSDSEFGKAEESSLEESLESFRKISMSLGVSLERRAADTSRMTGTKMWRKLLNAEFGVPQRLRFPSNLFENVNASGLSYTKRPPLLRRSSI